MKFGRLAFFTFVLSLSSYTALIGQYSASIACDNAPYFNCGDQFFLGESFIEREYLNSCLEAYSGSNTKNVWRTFIGDGSILQLKENSTRAGFGVFEGDCGDLFCSPDATYIRGSNSDHINLLSIKDKEYKLLLSWTGLITNIEVESRCVIPPINIEPAEALTIVCDDSVTVDLRSASSSTVCYVDYPFPNLWFKILGNNKVITLVSDPLSSNATNYEVFKQSSGELICEDVLSLNGSAVSFYGDEGISYLLSVGSRSTNQVSFSIVCQDQDLNDTCQNAEEIVCGDVFTANVFSTTPSIGGSVNDYYRIIEGEDKFIAFKRPSSSGSYQEVVVHKGLCEEDGALLEDYTRDKYFLEKGNSYSVKFDIHRFDGDKTLELICYGEGERQVCEDATPIDCNSSVTDTMNYEPLQVIEALHPNLLYHGKWYKIVGNGQAFSYSPSNSNLNAYFFTNTCNQLEYIGRFLGRYNWKSNNFQEYYIFIHAGVESTFSFDIDCYDLASNVMPSGALPVSCGETIDLDFLTSIGTSECSSSDSRPLYYKYINTTSDILKLEYSSTINSRLTYYKAENYNSCIETSPLLYPQDSVLLLMSRGYGQGSFTLFCEKASISPSCNMAIELESNCDIQVDVDFSNLIGSYISNECRNNTRISISQWYKIKGVQELQTIVNSSSSNFRIYLFEGDCNNSTCLGEIGSNRTFNLENGEFYYLFIERIINTDTGDLQGSFEIECREKAEWGDCPNEVLISCGETITIDPFSVLNKEAFFNIIGQEDLLELSSLSGLSNIEIRSGCSNGSIISPIYGGVYQLDKDSSYIVSVKLRHSSDRSAQFSISCFEPELATTCDENVEGISCGYSQGFFNKNFVLTGAYSNLLQVDRVQGKWFKLEGEGKHYEIRCQAHMLFSKNGCYTMDPQLTSDGNFEFYLSQTEQMYILVYDPESSYEYKYLNVYCRTNDPDPVVDCSDVDDVSCGDAVAIIRNDSDKRIGACSDNYLTPRKYFRIVGKDMYVRVEISEGSSSYNILEGDCITGTCIRRLNQDVFLRAGVTYYYEFHRYSNFVDLQFICTPVTVGSSVEEPIKLDCNSSLELDFKFNKISNYVYSCLTEIPQKGEWLSFIGNDLVVSVDLGYTSGRKALFEIVGQDTLCIVNRGDLRWKSVHGREYLIFVYSTERDVDPVRVSTFCLRQSENDDCEKPELITCETSILRFDHRGSTESGVQCYYEPGVDQFYKIIGRNNYISFSDEVYVSIGGCDEFTCIEDLRFNRDTYFLEDGLEYSIKTVSTRDNQRDISFTCYDGVDLSTCDSVIQINSTDTVIQDDLNWSIPFNHSSSCEENTEIKGRIYKFSNLGSYVSINVDDADYSVYSGECKDYSCVNPLFGNDVYFFEKGVNYFVLVKGDVDRSFQNFTLTIKNIVDDGTTNFNCNTPIEYSCGDKLEINFNSHIEERNNCLNSNTSSYNLYYKALEPDLFVSFDQNELKDMSFSRRPSCALSYSCSAPIKDFRKGFYEEPFVYFYNDNVDEPFVDVFSISRNSTSLERPAVKFHCNKPIFSTACNAEVVSIGNEDVFDNAFSITEDNYYDHSKYRGVWYKLENQDTSITVDVEFLDLPFGTPIEGNVLLFSANSCYSLNQVSSHSLGTTLTVNNDAEYYMLLTFDRDYFVSYRFHIDIVEPDVELADLFVPPVLYCDTTFTIDFSDLYAPDVCTQSCNRNYQFKIVGTDDYYALSALPNGSTEYLEPNIRSSLIDTLFLIEGVDYTVTVENNNPLAYSDEVRIDCVEPIQEPLDTTLVLCGDVLIGSTYLQYPDTGYTISENHLQAVDFYKIVGTDELMYLTAESDQSYSISYSVIDTRTNYLLWNSSIYQTNSIFLDEGVEYLLLVYLSTQTGGQYEVTINCEQINENSRCVTPKSISCNEELIIDFTGAIDTSRSSNGITHYRRDRRVYASLSVGPALLQFTGLDLPLRFRDGPCENNRYFSDSNQPMLIEKDTILELYFWARDRLLDTVTITCYDVSFEDTVDSFYSLSCTDTLEIVAPGVWTFYKFHTESTNRPYYKSGYFLKIIGENNYAQIEHIENQENVQPRLVQTADSGELTLTDYFNDDEPILEGEEILVFIERFADSGPINHYTLTCIDLIENSFCDAPIELDCDTQISYDFRNSYQDSVNCNSYFDDYKLLYYTYYGQGSYFRINNGNRSLLYEVLVGECDQFSCYEPSVAEWYWGAQDRLYTILLYYKYNSAVGTFTFECAPSLFDMNDGPVNDDCLTIGQMCDDANFSTVNDVVNDDCICQGVILKDLICENDSLFIYNIANSYKYYHTKKALFSGGKILSHADILFKSGETVELQSGFEIYKDGLLEISIEACPE